jgi:hypothetical protein
VLTTCEPSTVWCSRERLPAAAAQPAKVRQSCSATDYYYYLLLHRATYSILPSPTFRRVRGSVYCFVTKNEFYGGGLLDPAQPPNWRTTHCRLSATACSIYSQLHSISRGRLLYPQPEVAPSRGENGPVISRTGLFATRGAYKNSQSSSGH